MRKIALLMTATLFMFGSALNAQNNDKSKQERDAKKQEQLQKRVDDLHKIVNLTAVQKTSVLELYAKAEEKMRASITKEMSEEQKKEAKKKSNQEIRKGIMEILTPEQLEKYKADREKKNKERGEKGQQRK